MSNIDDDTVSNTSNNETLEHVAARVLDGNFWEVV
jgi:hypothetical protein